MAKKKSTGKYVICWNNGNEDPWRVCDGMANLISEIDDILTDGSGVCLSDITVFKVEETFIPEITLKKK